MIAAADPFSLAGSDLAAAAVVVGSAGSVVAAFAVGLAVDSAATVFVAADPDSAVAAADLACSGSVCSFAVGTGRVAVAISCSLTARSSF